MEAGEVNFVTRGGNFDWFDYGFGGPASYSDGGWGPDGMNQGIFGFRPAMYIK